MQAIPVYPACVPSLLLLNTIKSAALTVMSKLVRPSVRQKKQVPRISCGIDSEALPPAPFRTTDMTSAVLLLLLRQIVAVKINEAEKVYNAFASKLSPDTHKSVVGTKSSSDPMIGGTGDIDTRKSRKNTKRSRASDRCYSGTQPLCLSVDSANRAFRVDETGSQGVVRNRKLFSRNSRIELLKRLLRDGFRSGYSLEEPSGSVGALNSSSPSPSFPAFLSSSSSVENRSVGDSSDERLSTPLPSHMGYSLGSPGLKPPLLSSGAASNESPSPSPSPTQTQYYHSSISDSIEENMRIDAVIHSILHADTDTYTGTSTYTGTGSGVSGGAEFVALQNLAGRSETEHASASASVSASASANLCIQSANQSVSQSAGAEKSIPMSGFEEELKKRIKSRISDPDLLSEVLSRTPLWLVTAVEHTMHQPAESTGVSALDSSFSHSVTLKLVCQQGTTHCRIRARPSIDSTEVGDVAHSSEVEVRY